MIELIKKFDNDRIMFNNGVIIEYNDTTKVWTKKHNNTIIELSNNDFRNKFKIKFLEVLSKKNTHHKDLFDISLDVFE